MTFRELSNKCAEALSLNQREAKRRAKIFLDVVQHQVHNDRAVHLPELGALRPRVKEPKETFNPHYESMVHYPARRTAEYLPSSSLKIEIEKLDK